MTSKVLLAGGLLVAFLAGAVFRNYNSNPARAFAPPTDTIVAPAPTPTYYPARRVVRAEPVAYRAAEQPVVYQEAPQVKRGRSWEREVLIVAGSSGAGAAIGGIAGGGKGAAIGAVSGGVAGLVYDIATRNK